jgi:hypothetical protein
MFLKPQHTFIRVVLNKDYSYSTEKNYLKINLL